MALEFQMQQNAVTPALRKKILLVVIPNPGKGRDKLREESLFVQHPRKERFLAPTRSGLGMTTF